MTIETRKKKTNGPGIAPDLSHLTRHGQARMVSVAGKAVTQREAWAEAWVDLGSAAKALRASGGPAKGNVIETSRIAGILAAKRTATLIPMCHSLPLDGVDIEIRLHGTRLRIESHVMCCGKTGVEMEALSAATVAALSIYDMCKAAGKDIVIEKVRLLAKTGGKSGDWHCGESRE